MTCPTIHDRSEEGRHEPLVETVQGSVGGVSIEIAGVHRSGIDRVEHDAETHQFGGDGLCHARERRPAGRVGELARHRLVDLS